MQLKVVVVDFELSRRAKAWAIRLGVPLFLVTAASALAYANLPQFQDQSVLTADALNATFAAVAPPGTILAFAGNACPDGTIAADGQSYSRKGTYAKLYTAIGVTYGSVDTSSFNVPNAQGVFLRGAGTQTISGVGYSGTQGVTQHDQFQGHFHNFAGVDDASGAAVGKNRYTAAAGAAEVSLGVGHPIADEGDGPPRFGSETRPANISVLYCIWF